MDHVNSLLEKLSKHFDFLKRGFANPLTTEVGIEPIGNEEFVPIVKTDYGFDWDNRKFLVSEDYQPE